MTLEKTETHDRRTVLKLAGAGGAAIATITFVAGCGSGGDEGSGGSKEAAQPSAEVQAAVEQAVTGGQVKVGGAAFLEEAGVVVTQPTAGDYKVFSDKCPHQNAPVTMLDEGSGRIVCVLHGSQFDPTTGEVVVGPSARGLTPMAVDVAAPAPTST